MIFQGDELFFEYMYDAHQRQQFVNNERVDTLEQNGLTILKRYTMNYFLSTCMMHTNDNNLSIMNVLTH